MTAKRTTKATAPAKTPAPRPKSAAQRRRMFFRAMGTFLTSRSRDIALMAIVLGAFVAVFDGSLYSAKAFSFVGWSAIAFAIMPDALMVLSAAKMRQVGISRAQHAVAKRSMRIGLGFSLLTNMIAAFLRNAPEAWISPTVLLVGAIAYHGMVVVFLWCASETLTKTRADRQDAKSPKGSEAPVSAPPVTEATPVAAQANGHKAFDWSDVRTLLIPARH